MRKLSAEKISKTPEKLLKLPGLTLLSALEIHLGLKFPSLKSMMSGIVLKNRRKNVLSWPDGKVTQALGHPGSSPCLLPVIMEFHRARGKQQGSRPVPTHVRSHSHLTQDKKVGEGRVVSSCHHLWSYSR